jgi:hypothetical protein
MGSIRKQSKLQDSWRRAATKDDHEAPQNGHSKKRSEGRGPHGGRSYERDIKRERFIVYCQVEGIGCGLILLKLGIQTILYFKDTLP